ncbi:hypothetical protein HK102_004349 [Quaeritorhiza haematococci]|nr:hypothetical protein HK102_004349 [Quaeritorhiza haematococci]
MATLRSHFVALIALLLCSGAERTLAHGLLAFPPPRNDPGMSVAPGEKIARFPPPADILNSCHTSTPGPIAATLTAGQAVNVRWDITIPHPSAPGVRIAFARAPGANFEVLAEGVDVNLNAYEVRLPADVTSPNAIIQWVWASETDGGFYLGCSDVAITAQAAAPAAPAGSAAPVVGPASGTVAATAPTSSTGASNPLQPQASQVSTPSSTRSATGTGLSSASTPTSAASPSTYTSNLFTLFVAAFVGLLYA